MTVTNKKSVSVGGRFTIGELLRSWRVRRRITQLELALEADVSQRHMSFLETGRAQPSREMVLRLAGCLDLPLRARNDLLVAAGYAPVFPERSVNAPELTVARQALDRFLHAHEPYPAIVVDRHYDIVIANDAFELLTADVDADALEPRANTLRIFLHPRGLARELVDLEECSGRLLRCLRRQTVATADPELEALYEELCAYPGVSLGEFGSAINDCDLLVPLRLRKATGELAFFTTISTFGTAVDITLAELSIEALYPADERTAALLHRGGVAS